MPQVLYTFVGFHDPYSLGLLGDEQQPGPILSLLGAQKFDNVVLFSTPGAAKQTDSTLLAIHERYPAVEAMVKAIGLDDPTDYGAILRGLRGHLANLAGEFSRADRYVAVASGTPQMHACWIMLVASGELPARILHVRPPRFVTRKQPMVAEVNLDDPAIPEIRLRSTRLRTAPGATPDPAAAADHLGIVGDHPRFRTALDATARLATEDIPILLLGETGTGKEIFARFVHYMSPRRNGPFVPLNCAALPRELVESLLFGHKKGAFTGALQDHIGKFQEANGGTLFLDEIGDLPLELQPKFLRVLQDGMVEPVGSRQARKADVRIVAATNLDIEDAVESGRFRADLYYRLSMGEVSLPALRQRRSDIPLLALHGMDQINRSLARPRRLSARALERLQGHEWPGNVRELLNVLERSARLAEGAVLGPEDLVLRQPRRVRDPLAFLPEPLEGFSLEHFLGSARRQLVLRALEAADGNRSRAARFLGISPQAVSKFLKNARESQS